MIQTAQARQGILLLGLLFSLCAVAPASVLDEAASGIERHRKGEAAIAFRGKDGGPVANAAVEVRQRTHDFPFGNYIRPRHYNNETFLTRFKEVFNFIELLEFNWGQYEPDEGTPLLDERMRFINGWCRRNGLEEFYGHMLVWSSQYGTYPKTALPLWLLRYDRAKQVELLKGRIQREVRDYRDVNITWDVVNEATHCRVWGEWERPSYVSENLDDVYPYVRDALRWAHEANPNARLLINDYRVIIQSTFRERYKTLLERLRKDGAPLSAVGIQAHEPYKGAYWYSPEELWRTYDLFGGHFGLPIYITEFFYVSDPNRKIEGSYRGGNWSEDRQADAIEEFYRVSFGHPQIRCIIYFGLTDSDTVQPTCGLLDERYRPKPAWERLKRLLREEWITRQSGETAPNGSFRFRGFYGRYEVLLKAREKTRRFEIHLRKGQPNRWEFTAE